MTVSNLTKKLTFDEYLNYDDGTENSYEFVDGRLLLMNPPLGRHSLIIRLISKIFESEIEKLKLDWLTLQHIGIRTAFNRARIPDLSVVTREQIQAYIDRSAVLDTPPLIAIEVVSPESVNRDYRFKRCSEVLGSQSVAEVSSVVGTGVVSPISDCIKKRSEYATAGILEYWIIDPTQKKVTILQLIEGFYEEKIYTNNEQIVSPTLSELAITIEQLWNV